MPPEHYIEYSLGEVGLDYVIKKNDYIKYTYNNKVYWTLPYAWAGRKIKQCEEREYYKIIGIASPPNSKPVVMPRFKTDKPYPFGY